MKAIVYRQFGSPDVLQVAEQGMPTPAKGQVLVEMRATSVNVIDTRSRQGILWPLVNKKFPKVPGADVAGVVTQVGEDVREFRVGDSVFGMTDPFKGGAFAEFVAIPTSQLAPIPKGVSFEDAASLPVAGLAALQSLRNLGKIVSGSNILFHGASGAMGLFAIQIAKRIGAQITAVASTNGVAAMRSFGADTVIDYRKTNSLNFDLPFDVIVNASGKVPYAVGKQFLKLDGRLVEPSPTIPIFIGSKLANIFRRQKHLMLQTTANRADLDELAAMVANSTLKTTIAKVYSLVEAKNAFVEMEKGGVVGKIIVKISKT